MDERFVDEDWYGRELDGAMFVGCVLRDVDLTEAITRGCTFERCDFSNCRLNASSHHATAFVACTMRPLTVRGGQWRGVTLRGARLDQVDLSSALLRETSFPTRLSLFGSQATQTSGSWTCEALRSGSGCSRRRGVR